MTRRGEGEDQNVFGGLLRALLYVEPRLLRSPGGAVGHHDACVDYQVRQYATRQVDCGPEPKRLISSHLWGAHSTPSQQPQPTNFNLITKRSPHVSSHLVSGGYSMRRAGGSRPAKPQVDRENGATLSHPISGIGSRASCWKPQAPNVKLIHYITDPSCSAPSHLRQATRQTLEAPASSAVLGSTGGATRGC